jgi:hypothetical protein
VSPNVTTLTTAAPGGSIEDGAPIEATECVADRASVDPDLRAFLVSVDEPPQDQIDAFFDRIAGVERACAACPRRDSSQRNRSTSLPLCSSMPYSSM